MDIYTCSCGERWSHGDELGYQRALQHDSLGHKTVVGDYDQLVKEGRLVMSAAPDVPNPMKPEIPPGSGKVDTWGEVAVDENIGAAQHARVHSTNGNLLTFPPHQATPTKPALTLGWRAISEWRAWLMSDENFAGFEQEVGRYLSSHAWRRLVEIIDGLPH